MGNRNAKSSLRNAIIHLNISADPVGVHDDKFWSKIWTEDASTAAEVIKSFRTQEIRMLRDGSPKNFATLTYKMVERLSLATGTLCNTQSQQTAVLNATRILIRILPCIFEDQLWRSFFVDNKLQSPTSDSLREEPILVFPNKQEKNYRSYLPTISRNRHQTQEHSGQDSVEPDKHSETIDKLEISKNQKELPNFIDIDDKVPTTLEHNDSVPTRTDIESNSLIKILVLSTCDLLFCPEFTVTSHQENYLSNTIDTPPEDLKSISTCDYVWEPGVGFESNVNSTTYYDKSRSELLRLILTCISTTLYETPDESIIIRNHWIEIFSSSENRHALPLFTSILNTIFTYKATGLLPFNHLIFEDKREELVELSVQVLIATLDYHSSIEQDHKNETNENLFIEYASRIHRSEDFVFIIEGFSRLLNNRLEQSYLPNSTKHINFDQELLVLFWRLCNLNKKFINYLTKTNYVHDIVIPILYHLNENFQDPTKTALIHIGVFNLLILSGERNFGVRLNKPFGKANSLLSNLPTINGSHADIMIVIVHKLILYGHNLNQLFNFLMTIIVNISPYLKALSMLASKCLIQLFEIFSSPFIIFTEPNYHQLVVFLLEIFNNLVQYQFDGNANLVYIIISKSDAFLKLANLPSTQAGIQKVLNKLIKKKQRHELIEKLLSEQQQNRESDSSSQSYEQRVSNHSSTRCCESLNQLSATLSSNQQAPASPSAMMKQEVTLVATPDICKATHRIHPCETDSQFSNSDFFFSNSSQKSPTTMDVEDMLTQTSDSLSQVNINEPHNNNNNVNDHSEQSFNNLNLMFPKESNEDLAKQSSDTTSGSPEHVVKQQQSMSEEPVLKATCKWRASPDWVKEWRQSLPLHTLMRMIEVLAPHIERLKGERTSAQQEEEMIKFLQDSTLVGLLPVPHPIVIRKYRTNNETTLWFRTCTWGIIYVRNTIWTETSVRLIKIVY